NEEGRIKEDPTGDQEIEKEEGRIKEDPTGDQEIENEEGVDASIDIEKKKANETRFEAEVEKTKDEERKPSYADIAYSELQPIIDLLEITENTLFLEDKKYPMFGEEPFDRQQKPPKESTIHIDWIRVGRTTLNPQLRLYDENFDFINVFSLIGFQNKLSFSHTFHGDPPQKIYLRISDKIGFIPGETGGVKYFDYLIKYYWEPEPEPDMEMALDMYMDTTPDADTAPDMYMDTTPEREEGVSPSP
ncbi:MAG: hypothetical protein GY866_26490, partial [Proteobacteria bacterium]|nr:hypothetical protein [Pseudomonadota bacterium]